MSSRGARGSGPPSRATHNDYLDWFSPGASKHPVFGKVIDGLDVLSAIEKTPTDAGDRPLEPVKMIKVTVSE